MFTCVLGRYVAFTVLSVPNLWVGGWGGGGADRVGGQLRGDKECPFSGVTKFWTEEGAGKRCSECGLGPVASFIIMGHRSAVPKSQNTFCSKCRIKQINK